MFTLAEIDGLHARLGRAESLGDYLRELAAIGVVTSESFVTDGHTEYVAADGSRLSSPSHHEVFAIAATSDRAAFLEHLQRHADKETSYVEMSAGLASAGVEKWVADTAGLTMTYVDLAGRILLTQDLRRPAED